jgi:cell division protein ZapA
VPANKATQAPAAQGSIRVEIYDQAYNLRGTDADYILKLAEYVDLKMRAVAEKTATVDSLRVAVLAALNIADEYHLLKKKYDAVASIYEQRASSLSGMLDEIIEDRRVG